MEDQIISALKEPGITGEQLLALLPEDINPRTVNGLALMAFQRIARNEQQLMPRGMSYETLARLLDQLIFAAKNRSRAKAGRGKEQDDV